MKQGMKSILVAAVVLSISRGSYAAEYPHYYELPGVVITATRTENTIEKVPASMQVITEADIRRSGAHSMRNLLTDFANIFQKSKVRGGGHDIIIRGMSTDKSLIMINGRRVANEADASGLGNAMALDRINLSNVERVEIVRGPSSALYGSEAMGGVINIITRPSMKISLVTGLEQTSMIRAIGGMRIQEESESFLLLLICGLIKSAEIWNRKQRSPILMERHRHITHH